MAIKTIPYINGNGCTCSGSTCTGTCIGTCSTCSYQCDNGCTGKCDSSCEDGCYGCGSGCTSSCYDGCKTGCKGCKGCSGTCSGNCDGCTGGCTGGCGNNCQGTCNRYCGKLSYTDAYNIIKDGLSDIIKRSELNAMMTLSKYCFSHRGKNENFATSYSINQYTTKTIPEIFNAIKTNLVNSGAYLANYHPSEFKANSGYNSDGIVNQYQKINKEDMQGLLDNLLYDYGIEIGKQ